MRLADLLFEPPRVASLVAWDALATPGVLVQQDGSLLASVRFRGPDLHSAMDSALIAQANRLNSLFMRLGGGWCVQTEARREAVTTYPETQWPDPVSAMLDAERAAYFGQPATHYETTCYLTLTHRQPRTTVPGWKPWVYANLPEETSDDDQLDQFESDVQRILGLLKDCCEEVTRLDGDALGTYLHSTVSPKQYQVTLPDPACYLDSYLTDADLTYHWRLPSLVKYPQLGETWLRCVAVKAYPHATNPGLLEVLEALPLAYRACIRHLPLDLAKAVAELRRYRKTHWGQRKSASAMAAEKATGKETALLEQIALDAEREVNQAQADVQHRRVSYGYPTQVVVVSDPDWQHATAKAQQVEQALNTAGFTAKIEGLNTLKAWMSTLPGNTTANVRRPLMNTRHLAHLIPATQPWSGPPWNAHLQGPPLLRTVGRGHSPFNLDLYDGDVGMTYIAGPIGSGKSTCLATLAAAWLKRSEGQVFIFDVGQASRCLTYAVGGDWFDVSAELERLTGQEGHLDDPDINVWGSLWTPPPGRWQCFELGDVLKTPGIVDVLIPPLVRTLETRLTGAPTLFIFDEGHLYLRHPALIRAIDDYERGLRKQNAALVFATQSIADAARSPLGPILNESSMTRILLSNVRALEPEAGKYYTDWGLNDRQREIIAHLTPKEEYYYQSRQGHRVFSLGLRHLPKTLAFVGSGSKADLAAMAGLYQGNGPQFAEAWLRHKGLGEEA